MALTIKHTKVSAIPDDADTSLIRPSDWNADHSLAGVASVAQGGTGVGTLTGIVKGNGTGNMTAATGADIAAAIGTTVITNASYASSAGDITGGIANQILYQNGVASTHYVDAPTTASTFLSWNGTDFAWATAGGGGAVSKIIAGTGISIDPPTGVGDVTINSTGGGSLSGQTQSVSPYETSLGFEAGNANTGVNNTYLGYQAGRACTGAVRNVVIGFQAMDVATIPSDCVVIGSTASGATSNTLNNVVIGANANGTATTNAGNNVYIGYDAGRTTTGASNIFIGSGAGTSATTATQIVAIGGGTLGTATSSAAGAVAVGHQALGALTSGAGNIGIGLLAGTLLTTGTSNTCVGNEAGKTMVTSSLNTFIGYRAGLSVTGSSNTIVGANVTPSLTSGAGNTFIGVGAGVNVSTGSNNTVIGNGPLPTASTNNTVAIYDGVGDLAVLFNDPGAMTFDGTDFGGAGSFLRSAGSTARPTWTYPNQQNVASITADTQLNSSISVYFVDATAGAITATLPSAGANIGVTMTVKRTDGSANTVTVASAGGFIEGGASASLGPEVSIIFCSDGTNWWELANG